MKILHIGKFYPPYFGGIEKVSFDLVEGINDSENTVDVLCSNHEKNGHHFSDETYQIYRVKTIGILAATPISIGFASLLKRIQNEYDIIHVHLPNPLANLAVFLTRPKCKIILHWHSDIVKQKILLKLYSPLQNWLLKRADKIVATSPNYINGSKYLQKFIAKTNFIPLGIDVSELKVQSSVVARIHEEYEGKKIVFSLGRLIYYKGFEYLIEAAKLLDSETVILIGGVGKLQVQLQQLIIVNKLQDRVKLLGKIPFKELGAYYKACDLYCMPSIEKSEAFGVVQIEAMAFGKPIVSTNILGSGVPWVNKDGYSGKVVEPKNSKELASAIKFVLSDKEQYAMYSRNSLKRYNEYFTKVKMVERFKEFYVETIA